MHAMIILISMSTRPKAEGAPSPCLIGLTKSAEVRQKPRSRMDDLGHGDHTESDPNLGSGDIQSTS